MNSCYDIENLIGLYWAEYAFPRGSYRFKYF